MAKKEVKKDVKKTSKNEKNDKNKKTFFKSFKNELKKVVWPTPKQLVNSTVTVITIVLICAAIVFVLDVAFEAVKVQGIDRIKNVVSEQSASENATTNEATNSTTTENTEGTNSGNTEIPVETVLEQNTTTTNTENATTTE